MALALLRRRTAVSDYVSALHNAIRDPDREVQAAGRLALSRVDRVVTARGSMALLCGEDRLAKLQVIAALADGGGPEAVEALERVIAEDSDEDCRAAATRALGRMGVPEAEQGLVAAARDEAVAVRMEAARALGDLAQEAGVAALVALLEGDPAVAAEAAASLGRLRSGLAIDGLLGCLKSPSALVRAAAAAALGEMRDARVVPGLADALADPDRDVRLAAAQALARAPVPEQASG
jgi:HEAT repeat protein